ncbi:MAG: PD40 domain-containing protein [Deltaproteobacteria bacterium]|nr:PD40 domain-containing protein [Deltaproteobacteria bacterium]
MGWRVEGLIFFVVFVCLVAPVHAAFYKPSLEIYTLKTEHFYIHYPKEAAEAAQDLSEIAERVHAKLTEKFRWTPWGRTHVVLVDQNDQANGLATVIPANYLLLFITPPDSDSSLDNYKNYLELLFTHEYSHILHIDQHHRAADPFHWVFGKIVAPNGLTPGWMREGIAAWQETVETGEGRGNSPFVEMVIRTAVYEDKFPHIDEAAGTGLKWPGGNTQYLYGVKFWQWLAGKYGEESIVRYMEEYSSGLWLFSLNNKARRIFNKSFYKLWNEWRDELRAKYAQLKTELTAEGVTPFVPFITHKDQLGNFTPHPSGTGYAYSQVGLDEEPKLKIVTKPGKEPIILKRGTYGQMSFSRDGGNFLAFGGISGLEAYRSASDITVYDLKNKKLTRLYETGGEKKSLRASDPDFSPEDGGNRWVVMVRTNLGTDNLYVYDRPKKKGYYLTNASKYTQFSNPRFSPDGQKIVVSRRDHEGNRNIVLYSKTGEEIRKLTDDEANDNHPIWSPDGHTVYFESDAGGIPNIYRVNISGGKPQKITNVLTGVYQPQISPDGQKLFAKYYTAKGTDIYQVNFSELSPGSEPREPEPVAAPQAGSAPQTTVPTAPVSIETPKPTGDQYVPPPDKPSWGYEANPFSAFAAYAEQETVPIDPEQVERINPSAGIVQEETVSVSNDQGTSAYESALQGKNPPPLKEIVLSGSKKYSAFPQMLVPRYIVPTFVTLDDAFLFGFSTGRFDPMYRHVWNAYANYRTDAGFVGGGFNYAYTRYRPTIFAGAARYAINWGDLFGTGEDFFEQRLQGYAGVSLGLGHHALSVSYFYEDRDDLTAIPAGFALDNLDRYAGFRTSYTYARFKQFPNSISQEDGPYLNLTFDITDSLLGAADVNEQRILTGDFRYYFEMPYADHHVFGLRATGGFVWGDPQFQGTFRFGGPFGEGNLAQVSSRLFSLRGLPGITFAGDRALVFTGEYRLPLASVDRGIGTLPLYLRKLHLSFFADYGDSWFIGGKDNRGFFEDFFLGVGTELKGDLVIGYGLPVTARLGYAIIVLNRDQIAGLTDNLFGQDIRNGTFYFQFGTSF